MTRIVLDSNVIISTPEILTKQVKNVKIIIPDIILDEINRINLHDRFPQNLSKIIFDGAGTDYIEIVDAQSFITKFKQFRDLSLIDTILINFFKEYSTIYPDSLLVTDDRLLINFLDTSQLKHSTTGDLLKNYFSNFDINQELNQRINTLKKEYKKESDLVFY